MADKKIKITRLAHPGNHLHKQDDSLPKLEDLYSEGYDRAMLIIDDPENTYRQKPYERGSQPQMEEWENKEVELGWLINEATVNHNAPLFAVLGHVGTYSIVKVWSSTDVEKPVVYVGSGDRMAALEKRTIIAKQLKDFTVQELPEVKEYIKNYIDILKQYSKGFSEDAGNKGRTAKINDLDNIEEYLSQNPLNLSGGQMKEKITSLTGLNADSKISEAIYKFQRILSKVTEFESEKIDEQRKKEKGVGEERTKKDERFQQTLKEDIVALKKRAAYLEYLIESLKKINDAGISQAYINKLSKALAESYNLKIKDVRKEPDKIVISVESPNKFTKWTWANFQKVLADKGFEAKEWGTDENISNEFTIEVPTTVRYKNLNPQYKAAIKVFIEPDPDMPLEKMINTLDVDFLKEYKKVINEILKEDIENAKSDKQKGFLDKVKSLFTKTETKKYMETDTGEQKLQKEEDFYKESK